jgi:citronellol/citronellal dehydrogenase
VIATDAINMIPGVELSKCRTPEILSDTAHAILTTPHAQLNGQFILDEDFLRERGMTNFDRYAVDPSQTPLPDLFLD